MPTDVPGLSKLDSRISFCPCSDGAFSSVSGVVPSAGGTGCAEGNVRDSANSWWPSETAGSKSGGTTG